MLFQFSAHTKEMEMSNKEKRRKTKYFSMPKITDTVIKKLNRLTKDTNGTFKDDLLIHGENLSVLKTLSHQYKEKIKLIYIDPPFNTGSNRFNYPDKQAHEQWLEELEKRVTLLHLLLRPDGMIYIHLDDREAHYAKVACDSIFGRNNFVVNLIWQKKYAPANNAKLFSTIHDHILVYAKDKRKCNLNPLPRTEGMNARYKNKDNDPRGNWKGGSMLSPCYSPKYDYTFVNPRGIALSPPEGSSWRFPRATLEQKLNDNRIWFGSNWKGKPQLKQFLAEVKQGSTPVSIWATDFAGDNHTGLRELKTLLGNAHFSTPKPEKLLTQIITLSSNKNDIVLDCYAGLGSTCTVAQRLDRKFIGIEINKEAIKIIKKRISNK